MIIPPVIDPPEKIPEEFKLLAKLENPSQPEKDFLFLKYKGVLVIFIGKNWNNKLTGEVEYLHHQVCFPMEALSWVKKMFEYFFAPPKDGGLPAGKIATTDIIVGEKLSFSRGMCVGSPDHGGYMLKNLSRVKYKAKPDSKSFQRFDFPDPFLFNGGLLEFWNDLADRYENGEFE